MRIFNVALFIFSGLLLFWGSQTLLSIDRHAVNQQLRLAAAASDAEGVRAALTEGASVNTKITTYSDTAILAEQARLGETAVVNELLMHGDTLYPQHIDAAFSNALKQSSADMLGTLLAADLQPSAELLADQAGWLREQDPRWQALQNKYPDVVKEALQISLRSALRNGSVSQAKRVISAGALELFTSAECCFSEKQYLPNKGGVSVTVTLKMPQRQKLGALQTVARKESNKALIQFLLKEGVAVDSRDSDGKTALMWALWERNIGNAQQLLRAGANPNAKDNQGRTALIYAVLPISDRHFGEIYVSHTDEQQYEFPEHIMRRLLAKGLSPLVEDSHGRNALNYSGFALTEKGSTSILQSAWVKHQESLRAEPVPATKTDTQGMEWGPY